jgi:hypothetical protein
MLATISDVCRDSGFQSSQRGFGITSRLVESVLKPQEVSFGDGCQLRLAALGEQRSLVSSRSNRPWVAMLGLD